MDGWEFQLILVKRGRGGGSQMWGIPIPFSSKGRWRGVLVCPRKPLCQVEKEALAFALAGVAGLTRPVPPHLIREAGGIRGVYGGNCWNQNQGKAGTGPIQTPRPGHAILSTISVAGKGTGPDSVVERAPLPWSGSRDSRVEDSAGSASGLSRR